MSSKVLLVEDERTLSGIVRDALETMDFSVELAYDGSEGLRRYFENRPDILVVDVMMPKMSGFDMVKAIRQSDKETPILFLTAKTTVDDVVTGFNLGADDYLKKPFAIPELVVRMKNLLGRSVGRALDQEKGQESYSIGEYQFTPESATLLHKHTGESTLIPRREADILLLLCKGSGSIIPTQNILLSLWGDDDFFNARSLQVLITNSAGKNVRPHIHRLPALHNSADLRFLQPEAILLQHPGRCQVLREHRADYALQRQFPERNPADLPNRFRADTLGPERRQNHIANRPGIALLIGHPLHGNTTDNLPVRYDSPPDTLLAVILRHHTKPPVGIRFGERHQRFPVSEGPLMKVNGHSSDSHCTIFSNTSGEMVSSMSRYSVAAPVWQCWNK